MMQVIQKFPINYFAGPKQGDLVQVLVELVFFEKEIGFLMAMTPTPPSVDLAVQGIVTRFIATETIRRQVEESHKAALHGGKEA